MCDTQRLRKELIKLAQNNPETRKHLLPVLKASYTEPVDVLVEFRNDLVEAVARFGGHARITGPESLEISGLKVWKSTEVLPKFVIRLQYVSDDITGGYYRDNKIVGVFQVHGKSAGQVLDSIRTRIF